MKICLHTAIFLTTEQKLRILYTKTIPNLRQSRWGVYSRNRFFALRCELRSTWKLRISINNDNLYHAVFEKPILGEFANFKNWLLASSCLSSCLFVRTRRNFMKFDILVFFENISRMKNVSDKSCRENRNTHFMFTNFFENHAVYGIMCRHVVKPDRPNYTMAHAHWVLNN